MEDLQIVVSQQIGTIATNFDEIEKGLKQILAGYQGIVVTEDTVKESKKDISELRKLRTAIDDKKKEVKKKWNVPYVEFENKCKELMALVDQPINEINKQVSVFEKQQIEAKRIHLTDLFNENIEDFAEYIPFESTLEDKWQNVSYKDKDYLYRISEMKIHVRSDIDVIKSLCSEIEEELLNTYKKLGNNLSAAVQRNQQYLADKNRVKEQVKEEVKEEIKETIALKKPEPIKEFNDLSSKINMVHFVVSNEDADAVRQLLINNGIIFREE